MDGRQVIISDRPHPNGCVPGDHCCDPKTCNPIGRLCRQQGGSGNQGGGSGGRGGGNGGSGSGGNGSSGSGQETTPGGEKVADAGFFSQSTGNSDDIDNFTNFYDFCGADSNTIQTQNTALSAQSITSLADKNYYLNVTGATFSYQNSPRGEGFSSFIFVAPKKGKDIYWRTGVVTSVKKSDEVNVLENYFATDPEKVYQLLVGTGKSSDEAMMVRDGFKTLIKTFQETRLNLQPILVANHTVVGC